MNNICIKPHIPEGEDGFTVQLSDSSISVTIELLSSLPALLLATLLTESVFNDSSNEVGTLQLLIWDVGTGVFNFNNGEYCPRRFIWRGNSGFI